MKLKIFFTASYHGKAKYQKYFDMVRTALEKQDIELVSPEKGNVDLGQTKESHYVGIKKGIMWADAVVIDISEEGFQLGHEATLAMQTRKHVLCLSIHEDFSEKIKNRYFHGAKYSEYNIEEVVEEFVKRARKELLNIRFNVFLSARQMEKLQIEAKKRGINMSECIREMVDGMK